VPGGRASGGWTRGDLGALMETATQNFELRLVRLQERGIGRRRCREDPGRVIVVRAFGFPHSHVETG